MRFGGLGCLGLSDSQGWTSWVGVSSGPTTCCPMWIYKYIQSVHFIFAFCVPIFFGPCCHVFVLVVTCCIIVALAGCIAHAAYNVVHGSEFGVGFSSPADEPREWDVLPIFP